MNAFPDCSDTESKDIDKKINVLKQQIRSQQDSIVRLKESLLRAKNGNKYYEKVFDYDCKNDELYRKCITEFMNDSDNENNNISNSDLWLNAIVDDVIKIYNVFDFKTNPIGAKRNIYIDKQFTRLWMEYVTPRFNNETIMYYWLDYTTAMQMCQGYCKQYTYKNNRKFMVAIINYELKDKWKFYMVLLYVIMIKIMVLMTAKQIKIEYGIN